MPLSANPVSRVLEPSRSVRFEGHARSDGLRDIEAQLSEPLAQFPCAAIQLPAGGQRDNHDDGRKPFRRGRCHAPDTGGEARRLYYPRRQREAKAGSD